MPFELGLTVAWTKSRLRPHDWFVFEARRHRIGKSLSDLGGTDAYIHNGRPLELLRALANALTRSRRRPTVRQLAAVYMELRKAASAIRKDLQANSLFEARPFADLVVSAQMIAGRRIAPLRFRL